MNPNTLRKYTDIIMFFVMCFIAGTGLLIHYRLVPGFRGGHGLTLLGLSRHEWGEYHLWAAYLLIALVAVHITLDFSFVKNVIASKRSWLLLLLGSAGAILVLLFLLVPIERAEGKAGQGQGAVEHATERSEERGGDQGSKLIEDGAGRGEGRGPGLRGGRGKGQGRNRDNAER